MDILIFTFIVLPLYFYLMFVAVDTGFNKGFKSPIEDYSNLNFIKWIAVFIKKARKG